MAAGHGTAVNHHVATRVGHAIPRNVFALYLSLPVLSNLKTMHRSALSSQAEELHTASSGAPPLSHSAPATGTTLSRHL